LRSVLDDCRQIKVELRQAAAALDTIEKDHLGDEGLRGRLAKVITGAFSQLSRLDKSDKASDGTRVTLRDLVTIDLVKNKSLEKNIEAQCQVG
jgi:hypothetical protein